MRGSVRRAGLSAVRRAGRYVVLALGLVAAVLVSGCDEPPADAGPIAWPAGAAGLACNYLEYDRVADVLGMRFDTAGGARKDDTYTCALTQAKREYPDLVLSLTATKATEAIFQATAMPTGSTIINGLGKIAYRATVAPSDKHGAGLELGWLSAKARLMVLRYTFPTNATADDVSAFEPKLLDLAKKIEAGLGPQ